MRMPNDRLYNVDGRCGVPPPRNVTRRNEEAPIAQPRRWPRQRVLGPVSVGSRNRNMSHRFDGVSSDAKVFVLSILERKGAPQLLVRFE